MQPKDAQVDLNVSGDRSILVNSFKCDLPSRQVPYKPLS